MNLRIQSINFDNNRSVSFETINRKYHFAMHVHQFAELVIPISGELTVMVEDRTEILKPGEMAFIFPFQPHGYRSSCKNELAIFVFSPAFIPDFFNALGGRVGTKAVFTPKPSTRKLYDKIIEKHDFELFPVKGIFYLTLSDLLSTVSLTPKPKRTDISASVIDYVCKHISEDISVEDIARVIGYSPSFTSKQIKRLFGVNLSAVVSALRVDLAIDYMWKTDKSLTEISNLCGFGSQQSFNRLFKALISRTPSEHRASFKFYGENNVIKNF